MKALKIQTAAYLLFQGLFFLLGTKEASAHARTYVFNQEYRTLPQGTFEVESHTEFEVPDRHQTNDNEFTYEGEVEYGVTDRWNISNYQKWVTENHAGYDDDGLPAKDSTRYHGFKFESKYRIGEKGKYFVDPLLYVEWATDPTKQDNKNSIESKIVLSKDFDKLNVVYNQVMENDLGGGGRTTHEYTFGFNYEVLESFRLGMEAEGTYWTPSSNRNEIAMGPVGAYEGRYFWVAIGALFGVNHAANDVEARISVGVPIG